MNAKRIATTTVSLINVISTMAPVPIATQTPFQMNVKAFPTATSTVFPTSVIWPMVPRIAMAMTFPTSAKKIATTTVKPMCVRS